MLPYLYPRNARRDDTYTEGRQQHSYAPVETLTFDVYTRLERPFLVSLRTFALVFVAIMLALNIEMPGNGWRWMFPLLLGFGLVEVSMLQAEIRRIERTMSHRIVEFFGMQFSFLLGAYWLYQVLYNHDVGLPSSPTLLHGTIGLICVWLGYVVFRIGSVDYWPTYWPLIGGAWSTVLLFYRQALTWSEQGFWLALLTGIPVFMLIAVLIIPKLNQINSRINWLWLQLITLAASTTAAGLVFPRNAVYPTGYMTKHYLGHGQYDYVFHNDGFIGSIQYTSTRGIFLTFAVGVIMIMLWRLAHELFDLGRKLKVHWLFDVIEVASIVGVAHIPAYWLSQTRNTAAFNLVILFGTGMTCLTVGAELRRHYRGTKLELVVDADAAEKAA